MLRKFLALRPLLIAALFASVFLFAPKVPTTQQSTTATTPSASPQSTDAANSQGGSTAAGDQPTASIFEAIFGKGTTDPNFHLPDTTRLNSESPTNPFQEPDSEPARSIYRYLVASSDIGFDADATRLKLALATAGQGDVTGLNRLIIDFEQKLEQYKTLEPPEDLQEIHDQSAELVLRYIQHLKDARDAASGDIQKVWGSPERAAIGEKAQELNDQIRDIVHKYNISLPDGVLP